MVFLLRSVGHFLGMFRIEESGNLMSLSPTDLLIDLRMDKEDMSFSSCPLLLPVSCHILTLILDAALLKSQEVVTNQCFDSQNVAGKLIYGICSMAEQMLSQSREHRSSVIHFLLPIIFKGFVSHNYFQVSLHGKMFTVSR